MKRIVIIFIGLISVAYGQSSPTSAKTRFVNGLYVGTKLDSYFAAADSNAIYWRADSALMAKYKGTARRVVFSGELGSYLPIADTATMLSPYLRRTDSTGLLSQVVRTFGTQTIGGNKTFSNDIVVNGATVGRRSARNLVFGDGALRSLTTGLGNVAVGDTALASNTTANENTAVGYFALPANTTGGFNTAIGTQSLFNNTTGETNIGVGSRAILYNTTGSRNIGIGYGAGENAVSATNTTPSKSIFIGTFTRALAANQTNQIVIGDSTTGNGSNTVTIGNSSVTNNYFTGNIRGGAFIRSGGTSSQFLKADGSVDNNTYATTSSLSSYALTNLSNVNGVLSSTYGGAGSVSGILKANGSGVVSAAVAGTDYVIPSALSGYVDLTSTQTISGAKTFSSTIEGTNTSAFSLYQSGNTTNQKYWFIQNIPTAGTFRIRAINDAQTDGINAIAIDRTGISSVSIALGGTLNGTSLSMSGGGTIAGAVGAGSFGVGGAGYDRLTITHQSTYSRIQSFNAEPLSINPLGNDVLIGTTTTDGTNKLIVNGGVKGNRYYATGTGFGSATSAEVTLQNTTSSTGRTWGLNSADQGIFQIYDATAANATRFFIDSTGAATFSSSVTAGSTIQAKGSANDSWIVQGLKSGSSTTIAGFYQNSSGAGQISLYSSAGTENVVLNGNAGTATFSSSVTASSFIRRGGTSSQSLMADGSVQTVTSGSYTPTITNTTNVASSTPQVFYYTRVGNIVTVTGWVGIDITSNETSTVLGISLPIASTVNSFDKVIGIGNFYIGVSGAQVGKIEADTTNNRATLTFYPYFGAADGTVNTSIQFSYLVN